MTALYMDGFDHYSDSLTNMSDAGWSITNIGGHIHLGPPQWGPARTGPSCVYIDQFASGICQIRKALASSTTNLFVSFGFAMSSLPGGTVSMFKVLDGGANVLYTVSVTATGAINITNGAGVNATTAGPVIVPQNWHFIEMQFNTAGNFVLRVDDALGTDAPVLQTALAGGTIALFDLLYGTPSSTWNAGIDDLFVRDSSGSINNAFLGDRRIAAIYPNNDTTDAGWTPHFYKQISAGHARFAYMKTGEPTSPINLTASIDTNPATALNIGASDFTLESFVRFDRPPLTTEYYTIFNKWNESHANGRSYQLRYTGPTDGGVIEFRTSTDGAVGTVVSKIRYPWQPDYGTWYHVALCRSAGQLLLFVDGVQLGLPITDGDTYFAASQAVLSVGSQVNANSFGNAGVSGKGLIGRLDETRFTNGVGRYTASFAPPTVPFTRGVGDPDWASVVLLMGYDQSPIMDESSFLRSVSTNNNASQITATDGNPPGVWTTVGKSVPDDNTFIRASLTNATNIFTMVSNASNGDTVTVGTVAGPVAGVYTFKTVLASAFDVLIGATANDSLLNLVAAINAGPGSGTVYGTGTTSNLDVSAASLVSGQIQVTALIAGTVGNSIAVAETSPGSWANASNLTGGADIPGRSSFTLNRPPTNTTIISAVQLTTRARKTDSGVGTFKAGLFGPLGGLTEGPAHALTVNTIEYSDIIELDPDTSGPISPTTLINGKVSVNRTA